MGLFSKKSEWEQTFRLRSQQGTGRGLLSVLFWLWGGVGLVFNAGTLLGFTGSIGVGTSAYLAASTLVWIGGMVLFGIGALLSHSDFDGERPSPPIAGDVKITR
jgi:hypothetical protein